MDLNQNVQLIWGPGFLSEGKEYIVEITHVDTIIAIYKGTYKKPEKANPYVILYDVTKYDANKGSFSKTKCEHWICYITDKIYNAPEYKL